jgi:hypothetical protein
MEGRCKVDGTTLKLGKGAAFVKSRLRRHPQEDNTWEAAFQPIRTESGEVEFWLGMVVLQDIQIDLTHLILDAAPNINDRARLIANAIQRPLIECSRHRPETLLVSVNEDWLELSPHLCDIGIAVETVQTLPVWWMVAEDAAIAHARMLRSIAIGTARE